MSDTKDIWFPGLIFVFLGITVTGETYTSGRGEKGVARKMYV